MSPILTERHLPIAEKRWYTAAAQVVTMDLGYYFQTLFALPGVVIHELGHYLLCRLCGAEVQEVVFFQAAGPSGYVVHSVPRHLAQHLVIVAGPLILNSSLSFLLFRAAASQVSILSPEALVVAPWRDAEILLAGGLGSSIALQAIPSRADATSLLNVASDRLRRGYILAVLALPIAMLLIFLNYLRRFWVDWIYLFAIVGLAVFFPPG